MDIFDDGFGDFGLDDDDLDAFDAEFDPPGESTADELDLAFGSSSVPVADAALLWAVLGPDVRDPAGPDAARRSTDGTMAPSPSSGPPDGSARPTTPEPPRVPMAVRPRGDRTVQTLARRLTATRLALAVTLVVLLLVVIASWA